MLEAHGNGRHYVTMEDTEMEFTELSAEQVGTMQFAAGRERKGKDPYGGLLQAVKDGKTVLAKLEAGKQIKNLKWGISQAAKRAGMKIDMKVPTDQSGVVVSLSATAPTVTENTAPTPEDSPTGQRPRK